MPFYNKTIAILQTAQSHHNHATNHPNHTTMPQTTPTMPQKTLSHHNHASKQLNTTTMPQNSTTPQPYLNPPQPHQTNTTPPQPHTPINLYTPHPRQNSPRRSHPAHLSRPSPCTERFLVLETFPWYSATRAINTF